MSLLADCPSLPILNPLPTAHLEPKPPPEVWLLWTGREWVESIDEALGGPTYLAAFDELEALAAAAHQNRLYGIECTPVRVK